MRSINLSAHVLSDAMWTRLFEFSAARYLDGGTELFRTLGSLDALRDKAQYKTGSISTATQWALYSLAYQWQPQVVLEVGTYIGKSTIAMALGADAARGECEIHTCDASNTFDLPACSKTRVVQYPGSPSTQMLTEMVEDGFAGKVQLMHIDGRLSKDDIGLMSQLAASEVIVALDDFEGIEKGVANLFNIRAAKAFADHFAFYPPSDILLRSLGFRDRCTTCLLAPRDLIRFTAQ